MVSIDDMQEMLEDIAAELPDLFFRELNGGILLLPERRRSKDDLAGDLYTMGEYHSGGVMGRYIVIYYGSFKALFSGMAPQEIKAELKETLLHEFTHHLESLSGERGLEIKDEEELAQYLRDMGR